MPLEFKELQSEVMDGRLTLIWGLDSGGWFTIGKEPRSQLCCVIDGGKRLDHGATGGEPKTIRQERFHNKLQWQILKEKT